MNFVRLELESGSFSTGLAVKLGLVTEKKAIVEKVELGIALYALLVPEHFQTSINGHNQANSLHY